MCTLFCSSCSYQFISEAWSAFVSGIITMTDVLDLACTSHMETPLKSIGIWARGLPSLACNFCLGRYSVPQEKEEKKKQKQKQKTLLDLMYFFSMADTGELNKMRLTQRQRKAFSKHSHSLQWLYPGSSINFIWMVSDNTFRLALQNNQEVTPSS